MTKTGNQVLRRAGFAMAVIGSVLGGVWFGWHLLVVLALLMGANNIERDTY